MKDLEALVALNDEVGITQCPRCRLTCLRDKWDSLGMCIDLNCRVEFCFEGCCLRSPIKAHGAHYHRPQCKYYMFYNGANDKKENNCKEFTRLGVMCKPPKI